MAMTSKNTVPAGPRQSFQSRHNGPGRRDTARMLDVLGIESLDALIDRTVPGSIRMEGSLNLDPPRSEQQVLADLKAQAEENQVFRNFIGLGYSECVLPAAIQRGILENPGWYTAYTPYQAEISQGRLEALLNFQTMVHGPDRLEVANASLLDEGTAAAEAMALFRRVRKRRSGRQCLLRVRELPSPDHRGRQDPGGTSGDRGAWSGTTPPCRSIETIFGALVQYPDTGG